MRLETETVRTEILDPRAGHARRSLTLEVRTDPLTGHTARVLHDVELFPEASEDLAALARRTRPGCPFCADRIEQATPRFPPEVVAEGRIRVGEAVLFPNLLPYGRFASVSVYSPRLHHLEPAGITPPLLRDNLAAQRAFAIATRRAEPASRWASINANYMPPSGSSIFHPHLQGSAGSQPTTMQRILAGVTPDAWGDYLDTERRAGTRYIACTGRVHWLAAFAPLGPGEVRAVAPGISDVVGLDDGVLDELAAGTSALLALYARLGRPSFNLALYGCPGSWLSLRVMHRSPVRAYYRSDVTWLERMHLEAAVSLAPEDVAAAAREVFP